MKETAADRLRRAREHAGFSSGAEFARKLGVPEVTYRAHESGTRNLTIPAAKAYAKKLSTDLDAVTWQWLMFGDGVTPAADAAPPRPEPDDDPRMLDIDELDVSLSGGEGAFADDRERVIARWRIPATLVRGHTTAPNDRLKIVRVRGDSMAPEYPPGDRVLVDVDDRVPSPAGVFAIWDGFAEVLKRLEIVPYSDPPTVELYSINPAYPARKYRLDEVVINGRVIGKWDWKG